MSQYLPIYFLNVQVNYGNTCLYIDCILDEYKIKYIFNTSEMMIKKAIKKTFSHLHLHFWHDVGGKLGGLPHEDSVGGDRRAVGAHQSPAVVHRVGVGHIVKRPTQHRKLSFP